MNTQLWDIPRLYTGIAEWMACMVYVISCRPQMKSWKFLLTALAAGVVQCAFLIVTDNVPLPFWTVCMVLAWLGIVEQFRLLTGVSWTAAAYSGIRAFMLAEFAASLEWQLHYFLWGGQRVGFLLEAALLLAIYGGIYSIAWGMERRFNGSRQLDTPTTQEMITVAIIGVSIFTVSNLSFCAPGTPFSGHYATEIMNIRTLVDLGGVAILTAYHLQRQKALTQRELVAIQTILENQYAQYRMSRDSIDMINRKYHDLKHQIAALRAEPDARVREQWLDEMEEDIRSYEAQNKTGNQVLDTILTGKNLYCQKHGISLSVIADGTLLSFMDVMDICTLFGNAIDNAIECELTIPDKSKRMIHMTLSAQRQFLVFRVENYCPVAPEFQDGAPITTKEDPENHGFGVKSMLYTARKYSGSMTSSVENDWFVLKVLIPLQHQ